MKKENLINRMHKIHARIFAEPRMSLNYQDSSAIRHIGVYAWIDCRLGSLCTDRRSTLQAVSHVRTAYCLIIHVIIRPPNSHASRCWVNAGPPSPAVTQHSPNVCFVHRSKCVRIICQTDIINPCPAKLIYLNFHPLEVVSRYRDPQLQVAENCSYFFYLSINICKS